jgi:hypothetical protein
MPLDGRPCTPVVPVFPYFWIKFAYRAASRRRDKAGFADHCREAARLSEDAAPSPIRRALVIEDSALADRLAALLAGRGGFAAGWCD